MARYFIIGSGNPQDVESRVNEVLGEKNLAEYRRRNWKRATWWREVLKFASEKIGRPIYGPFDLNQDWDCLIIYSDDDSIPLSSTPIPQETRTSASIAG